MNDYRSYMDRIEVTRLHHEQLMETLQEGRAPARRGPRMTHYMGLAACLALVCLAGWGVLRGAGPQRPGEPPSPGVTETHAPGETEPPVGGDVDVPEDPYTLRPQSPFEGQPHGNSATMDVAFGDGPEIAARILYPDGWFQESLTREQMIRLLGGADADDAPWPLGWSGCDVTGIAIYDGQGQLWRVILNGVSRADGRNSFQLIAKPGEIPEDCVVDPEQTSTQLNGITVYGSKSGRYGWDASGELGYVYEITLLSGEAGIRFQASQVDEAAASSLATLAANQFTRTDGGLHLDGLLTYDGEIPEWRSESLTLQEARAEAELGAYVPTWVPAGFSFEGAHRELGQNRDWLSVFWSGYYTSISVTIRRPFEPVEIMDVSDKAYYDRRLYTIPYADSVPDEVMFGGFQDPVFRCEDLTLDVLESRLILRGDAGDSERYRGNFSVLYGDGILVQYSFNGVTPEQAAKMILG